MEAAVFCPISQGRRASIRPGFIPFVPDRLDLVTDGGPADYSLWLGVIGDMVGERCRHAPVIPGISWLPFLRPGKEIPAAMRRAS